ncbi:hypothetical protein BH09BAC6_BH09BAC6_17750 [soil metagenome]|jgi:hypothetical protein
MKMQDEEFDELFRSKLYNYQEIPSPGVWTGVAGEIAVDKRKRLLLPFLSIAASVLILVTAGILFIPKITKVTVKGGLVVSRPVSKDALPGIAIAKNEPRQDAVKLPGAGKVNVNANPVNRAVASHHHRAVNAARPDEPALTVQQPAPLKQAEQQLTAALPQKQPDANKPVVPGTQTPLAVKSVNDESPGFKTQPMLLTQSPAINNKDVKPVKAKHKIHSFGDLINVMIAKVDKRKDKVIEFTDSDDDEATVSGVNLGVIRIKKDNK